EVEVAPVVDVDGSDVIGRLLSQATPERLREIDWLPEDYVDGEGKVRAAIQSFVVRSGGATILVDTGVGDRKQRTEFPQWNDLRTGFLDRLRALGVEPADVTTVVCTHLHIDHVGWNTSLEGAEWRPTFPRAEYVFARAEYDDRAPRLDQLSADGRASMEDSVAPIAEAGLAALVDVDHELNTQIRLVPTAGHSSGHGSGPTYPQASRAAP